MIMSPTVEASAKKSFGQLISQAPEIAQRLLNISVMLRGHPPAGILFVASGVILYVTESKEKEPKTEVSVVTAKHNLYVFSGVVDPPSKDPADIVSAFQKTMMIWYDEAMEFGKAPAKSATINAIELVIPENTKPWEYDVMILKSTDEDFITFAEQNNLYTPPLDGLSKKVLVNPTNYLNRDKNNYFIQTGYGKSTDKVGKRNLPAEPNSSNLYQSLQYRFTKPVDEETVTVFNQHSENRKQYYQFQQAIQMRADNNDATAEGDSGGPLFLARRDKKDLYLIGVTTGADMAASEKPCPTGDAHENEIVTSLQTCYGPEGPFS